MKRWKWAISWHVKNGCFDSFEFCRVSVESAEEAFANAVGNLEYKDLLWQVYEYTEGSYVLQFENHILSGQVHIHEV